MKLKIVLIALAFLLPVVFVHAEDGLIPCSEYYKYGSIEVLFTPLNSEVLSGTDLPFDGSVLNTNSYPVLDGAVYVKIFKKVSVAEDWKQVDQFYAKKDINIAAQKKVSANFTWKVPAYAESGQYKLETYFVTQDKFNLSGLPFADDAPGSVVFFDVVGSQAGGVDFVSNSLKIDNSLIKTNAPIHEIDQVAPVSVELQLKNSFTTAQNVEVGYSLYVWDGLRNDTLVTSKKEKFTLNSKENKKIQYTITDTEHPIYYLVIESKANNTKSIKTMRFVRGGISDARLVFTGINSFPLVKGQPVTLFACFNKIGIGETIPDGKVVVTLQDKRGKKLDSYTYEGEIKSTVMGVQKTFVAQDTISDVTLVAELFSGGTLVDSVRYYYDCEKIDDKTCGNSNFAGSSSTIKMFIYLVSILTMVLVVIVLLYFRGQMKKKDVGVTSALLLLVMCLGVTSAAPNLLGSIDMSANVAQVSSVVTPAQSWTFANVGQTRWVVPSNVNKIRVRMWGAGGAGGSGRISGGVNQPGMGGGAGSYAESVLDVSPSESFVIDIGRGGRSNPGGASTAGQFTVVRKEPLITGLAPAFPDGSSDFLLEAGPGAGGVSYMKNTPYTGTDIWFSVTVNGVQQRLNTPIYNADSNIAIQGGSETDCFGNPKHLYYATTASRSFNLSAGSKTGERGFGQLGGSLYKTKNWASINYAIYTCANSGSLPYSFTENLGITTQDVIDYYSQIGQGNSVSLGTIFNDFLVAGSGNIYFAGRIPKNIKSGYPGSFPVYVNAAVPLQSSQGGAGPTGESAGIAGVNRSSTAAMDGASPSAGGGGAENGSGGYGGDGKVIIEDITVGDPNEPPNQPTFVLTGACQNVQVNGYITPASPADPNSGDTVTYEYQIDESSSYGPIQTTSNNGFGKIFTNTGLKKIRVRAKDQTGLTSEWVEKTVTIRNCDSISAYCVEPTFVNGDTPRWQATAASSNQSITYTYVWDWPSRGYTLSGTGDNTLTAVNPMNQGDTQSGPSVVMTASNGSTQSLNCPSAHLDPSGGGTLKIESCVVSDIDVNYVPTWLATATGGSGAYTYIWSGLTGASKGNKFTSAQPIPKNSQQNTLSVSVTDGAGRTSSALLCDPAERDPAPDITMIDLSLKGADGKNVDSIEVRQNEPVDSFVEFSGVTNTCTYSPHLITKLINPTLIGNAGPSQLVDHDLDTSRTGVFSFYLSCGNAADPTAMDILSNTVKLKVIANKRLEEI